MSEWHVQVVRLNQIERHPNADALEVATVHEAYPCIIRLGSFKPGDLAVYIPVDSIVPLDDQRFAFLSDAEDKKTYRIKAKKLRSVFSMGLLIPAEPDMQESEIVHERLRITKYDPEAAIKTGGEQEADVAGIPMYTDIESYRKYGKHLVEGTEVVLTEKLHGSNSRFSYTQGRLYCGSHHQLKKRDEANLWWRVAAKYDLETKLQAAPDKVFFGEVYGPVQKGYTYDTEKTPAFRVFDVYDITTGRYMDWLDVLELCKVVGLDTVPVLYQGPWSESLTTLRNGKTTLGEKHTREGFVVHPVREQYVEHFGRLILKFVRKAIGKKTAKLFMNWMRNKGD
jgi:RNA ligase (TIGR02306 family)